jgi:formyl-CoA transferase
MKEIAHDPGLRASAMIVEVPHKERGTYLTVGSPIKFSDFAPTITGSPLLGEHTDEVLTKLGYSAEQIAKLREANVLVRQAGAVAQAHQESKEPVGVTR